MGNLEDFGQKIKIYTGDSLQQWVPHVQILQVTLLKVCISALV